MVPNNTYSKADRASIVVVCNSKKSVNEKIYVKYFQIHKLAKSFHIIQIGF